MRIEGWETRFVVAAEERFLVEGKRNSRRKRTGNAADWTSVAIHKHFQTSS